MAFPGTYNINYYKGDTYEFRIYPKDAAGEPFDLTDFDGSETFTIANARGEAAVTTVVAYASISDDHILCAIRPADATNLVAGTTYYYDVQIDATGDNGYDLVHTLLTGTITVTDHVTGAA